MSWSVGAVGKPAAVAAKLAAEFSKNPCMEPEETIRQSAAKQIAVALAAFPDGCAVRVEASGSQSTEYKNVGKATNQLSVKIEPIWNFLE